MKNWTKVTALSLLAGGAMGLASFTTAFASTSVAPQLHQTVTQSQQQVAKNSTVGANNSQDLQGKDSGSDNEKTDKADPAGGKDNGPNVNVQVGDQNGPDSNTQQ